MSRDPRDLHGLAHFFPTRRSSDPRRQEMLLGQVAAAAPKGIKKGVEIDEALLAEVERHEWWKFAVADDARQAGIEAVKAQYDEAVKLIVEKFEDRVDKLQRGDEQIGRASCRERVCQYV